MRKDLDWSRQDHVQALFAGWLMGYTDGMSILLALTGSSGVVTRIHLSPSLLLIGCGLLAVAASLTRRIAQRMAEKPTNAVDTADLGREAALVGLVLVMLAAIALIAAGLFEYR